MLNQYLFSIVNSELTHWERSLCLATIKTTSWCTDLHRADTLNGVDSHEITLNEYDGRNLVTREVNALGDSTIYVYDGNGNMVSKTDADGYVTQYSYTALDLVQKINYNGAKEVSYQYNKVGEAEGDSGELTFQGTRYLNFRREGAE